MADNIEVGDLVARISFDDTGLNKSMAEINRQMKLVESEFDKASSALKAYGSEEEELNTQAKALTQQMDLQQQKINKLNAAFQESVQKKGADAKETQVLATQLNKAQAQYNKLDAELQQTNKRLSEQQQDVKKTETSWEKLQKSLDQAADKLNKTGQAMKNVGGTLTKSLTAPIAAFGGLAIKAASDFDGSAKQIQASLGLTAEEAEELNEEAKKLWIEGFGDSITGAANAVVLIKQQIQGLDNGEIKSLAQDALTLEQAFSVDVNESVRTASVLMKNFGIDGTQAMDLVTVGFQRGGDFSGELLDTLREYAPQFASMGKSADEMLAILIAGAEAGAFNLDKVGDAVKEFNILAADGSKATAEGFAALGLEADLMGAAIAAGGETASTAFNATIAALAAMDDPMQQNIAGVALFGTQWEDVRSQVILAMDTSVGSLGQIEGATKTAGETLQSSFGAQATQVWREFMVSLEPVGQILLKVAEQWLPKVSVALEGLATWFANLSPGMQQFIVAAAAIAAALGPVIMVVGMVAQGIAAIVPIISVVVGAFSAGGAAAGALGAALAAITGPIGIAVAAIAAIGAIVYAVIKNWESIKTFFVNLFNWFNNLVGGWGAEVLAALMPFIGIPLMIVKHWDKIKAGLSSTWDWIKNFFSKWGGEILAFLTPVIGIPLLIVKHWDDIKAAMSTAVKAVSEAIVKGLNIAIDWIKNLPSQMLEIGKNIIQGLIDGIGNMIGKIKSKVKEVANTVTDGLKNLLGINSPSKVTMELGEWTGEGMALGLQKSLSGVAQQAAAMSKAAIPDVGRASAESPIAKAQTATAAAPQEITIIQPVYLDGREVSRSVSKHQGNNLMTRSRGLGYG